MTSDVMFELCVRKTKYAGQRLPDRPAGFRPLRGDYPTVSKRAVELNDVQKGTTKPDYVFFADTIGPESNPLHCDICKRIAIREASRDED
ncbi:hypothetical protein J2Y69_002278 [Microbacterium resistens]|uniref:Uncharacterized protein n=1 Tax=Microbacterium resistens TaxID=156977 RepID=A0ABU1SDJ9_9MICO|nr:hypothetical protein [Microbacterium resistens]MDR6867674.1 hypothetical protein [Microbacterium resistens]